MKKGFTLVELLAVIVILAVISIITIPLIGNVVEDSRKKALEQSVYGLVKAANYYAIENDYAHVVFGENATQDPKEILEYSGTIDAEGDLYIDNDGNISLCLMNEDYYVYKNYNSGIYIGEMTEHGCVVDYDAITNKYVAMLDDGTGQVSNVYDKAYINNLEDSLQGQINVNKTNIDVLDTLMTETQQKIGTLETSIKTNTSDITTIKDDITSIQTDLNTYAAKTDLEKTNQTIEALSTKMNTDIASLQNSVNTINNNLPINNTVFTGTGQIVDLECATLKTIASVDVTPGTYLFVGDAQVDKSIDSFYQLNLMTGSSQIGLTRNISMIDGGGGNVTAVRTIFTNTTVTLGIYSYYNGTEIIKNRYTTLYAIKLS